MKNNHVLKHNLIRMISEEKTVGEAAYKKHRELEQELIKELDIETFDKVLEYLKSDREKRRSLDKWYRLTKELESIKEEESKSFLKKLFRK